MLNFLGKRAIETAQLSSAISGIISSLKIGALVQDTSFNVENILELVKNGTLEGLETIKTSICSGVNEIVNISDYLHENFDIPFEKYKNEPLVNIEQVQNDFLQFQENFGSNLELDPDKLENILTILVSMGAVSFIFIYLIPKILQKVKIQID